MFWLLKGYKLINTLIDLTLSLINSINHWKRIASLLDNFSGKQYTRIGWSLKTYICSMFISVQIMTSSFLIVTSWPLIKHSLLLSLSWEAAETNMMVVFTMAWSIMYLTSNPSWEQSIQFHRLHFIKPLWGSSTFSFLFTVHSLNTDQLSVT